ncbi:ArsR/SmtB family transcription factor [Peribacillus sp. SCS-37]|uniref:ArsR/SmtB family transcription factor n=1 Tax=Paraperibacillus esterisolvens TaxID=3115296 RepID=UPI0039067963
MKSSQLILRLNVGETSAAHDVFRAVADPVRRRMLKLLSDKEMPIAAISDCFPISRTGVKKHLIYLSDAGLVRRRKVGREMRYTLNAGPLAEIKDWVSFFEEYWDDRLAALKDYVERDSNL